MKKIFMILCAIMLMMCLAIPCFATDVDNETGNVEIETGATPESDQTIFTRLWEFIGKYKGETLTLVGDAVLLAIVAYMKLKGNKSDKEIKEALKTISKETGLSIKNQDSIVEVVNGLIESYNDLMKGYTAMKEAYEKYGETELDRNKIIGALAAEVSTVLEMLSTVYANNEVIPQGIKDLISIKYANLLKALNNDKELASVVEAVHNVVEGESTEGVTGV